MLEADWFGHEESDSVSCHPEPKAKDLKTRFFAPAGAQNDMMSYGSTLMVMITFFFREKPFNAELMNFNS